MATKKCVTEKEFSKYKKEDKKDDQKIAEKVVRKNAHTKRKRTGKYS
jgi:hypothetical protein